jgi:hypothetical protein
MFKLTSVEEYATTVYYAATLEDDKGNEFEFTMKEIDNQDIGSLTYEIIWLGEKPEEEIDDDFLVDLCYKVMNDDREPNDDQIYNNFNHEGGIKFTGK